MAQITSESLQFMALLEQNNNREWFQEHKKDYEKGQNNIIAFADALLAEMNTHDEIETPSGKKSLFRIYRDVRFSKDKSPYKAHWSGSFTRATAHKRGGYYFHLEPGNNSFLGVGFWAPEKDDLQRIREEIATDDSELREILNDPKLVNTFGRLEERSEQLKTAPKGFEKDHPAIDLLRFKQFIFAKNFSDKEVLAPDFHKKVSAAFQTIRPFFNYMSEVLTTDANGEPLF